MGKTSLLLLFYHPFYCFKPFKGWSRWEDISTTLFLINWTHLPMSRQKKQRVYMNKYVSIQTPIDRMQGTLYDQHLNSSISLKYPNESPTLKSAVIPSKYTQDSCKHCIFTLISLNRTMSYMSFLKISLEFTSSYNSQMCISVV